MDEAYIVFVLTDENGYITAVNSSAFLSNTDGWTEIDSGYGDKYHHAQGNYFPEFIMTNSGVWRYKLVDSVPMECTEEEIAAQEKALIEPEKPEEPVLDIYDELEAAYNEGVNSI